MRPRVVSTTVRAAAILVASVVVLAACGTPPTAPKTPANTAPKLFVVALNAIVYERTTPYTGGDIRIGFGTGNVFQNSLFSSSATRKDDTHWTAQGPSSNETFVFTVGEDYWLYLTDRSRSPLFTNPDYGDEFLINGKRLTRTGRVSDAFLFTSSAVRRFKFTDLLGTIE